MFAEAVACLIFVPVDVIKERRQVQTTMGFKYTSDFDAIRYTLADEGVRGLYKAYGATLLSFGPFAALMFNFYEYFKGICVQNDVQNYLRKIKRTEEQSNQVA